MNRSLRPWKQPIGSAFEGAEDAPAAAADAVGAGPAGCGCAAGTTGAPTADLAFIPRLDRRAVRSGARAYGSSVSAIRKPMNSCRLPELYRVRAAERRFRGWSSQEPPRITRMVPCFGPLGFFAGAAV